MAGLHCTDCVYGSFCRNEDFDKFQGTCSRGFTLADPHVHTKPDMFFAEVPERLVPIIDPFGKEYLRTKNICEQVTRPTQGTVKGKDVLGGRF